MGKKTHLYTLSPSSAPLRTETFLGELPLTFDDFVVRLGEDASIRRLTGMPGKYTTVDRHLASALSLPE